MTFESEHISIAIAKSKDEVYEYVSNPEHFPEWLGFMKSISKLAGNHWKAATDLGELTMDIVEQNDFGVVDHRVTLADGTTINNTLRVLANGDGSEVVFTVFQQPGKTKDEFEADAHAVRADLQKLKEILEG